MVSAGPDTPQSFLGSSCKVSLQTAGSSAGAAFLPAPLGCCPCLGLRGWAHDGWQGPEWEHQAGFTWKPFAFLAGVITPMGRGGGWCLDLPPPR